MLHGKRNQQRSRSSHSLRERRRFFHPRIRVRGYGKTVADKERTQRCPPRAVRDAGNHHPMGSGLSAFSFPSSSPASLTPRRVFLKYISLFLRAYKTAGSVSRYLHNVFFRDIFIIFEDINQSAHISANKKINLDKGRNIRT